MTNWSVVCILTLSALVRIGAGASSGPQQTRLSQDIQFEVASIRPSPLNTPPTGSSFLKPTSHLEPTSGLFSANGLFISYLMFAYDIRDPNEFLEIANSLPAWVNANYWNIQARAEGIPTRAQMQLMMQSLLKTRFKLAFHYENRKQPVYALMLSKPGRVGAALKPHTSRQSCSARAGASQEERENPALCGGTAWSVGNTMHFAISDVTMDQAVSFLGGAFLSDRRVVNRTGLSGRYDIHFAYVQGDPPTWEDWAEFAHERCREEIEKQLGVKFVPTTAELPTLIVDHIERPSPN